jgi:purine-binding chemotaxis protein CheW
VTDLLSLRDKSASVEELSLHELAAKIARETLGTATDTRDAEAVNPGVKHVLFVLNETQYAVPMENVLELQRLPRITPLPSVPAWLRGVTNLRGEVLSIVDLRSLLGLPAAETQGSLRLVVVRSMLEEIATGWIVDHVIGMRRLATEDLQPASTLTTGASARFVSGLVEYDGQLIAILDVNRILSSPEMRQFEPGWQAGVA